MRLDNSSYLVSTQPALLEVIANNSVEDGTLVDTKGWKGWEWTHGVALTALAHVSIVSNNEVYDNDNSTPPSPLRLPPLNTRSKLLSTGLNFNTA